LVIDVTDSGPGIPESDRERVFEMFYRAESARTDRQGGGLGLAICHEVIAAHGGSVAALVGPGGVGTTIRLRLPVEPAPVTGEQPA
jgi:two-component system sensor histidine kinase KdpD